MSTMPPKVSVVIINYGGILVTLNCLENLKKTAYQNFEVILVDNGSQFQKAEISLLKKNFGKFINKILSSKGNLGFAGANNLAFKKIKSKYIALLNNDAIVEPNWLEALVGVMEKDSKIAAVQPKIRWLLKPNFFEYAGGAGGYLDVFGYPFARGRVLKTIEKDTGQYDQQTNIHWASGAAMMIRRKALEKVGFFDKNFFNYIEEIDLCLRFWRAGYRVVFVPQSVIYHLGGFTSNKNVFLKNYWLHHNNLMLLLKHYPTRMLFTHLPIRLILNFVNFFYYLLQGEVKSALALAIAHPRIIYHLPRIIKSRNSLKKIGLNSKIIALPFISRSIVWQYFILGRKTYQEIFAKTKVKVNKDRIFNL